MLVAGVGGVVHAGLAAIVLRKREREEQDAQQEKVKREKEWKQEWDVCEHTT